MTLDQILLCFTGARITIREHGSPLVQVVNTVTIDQNRLKLKMNTRNAVHTFNMNQDFGDAMYTTLAKTESGASVEIRFRDQSCLDNCNADQEALLMTELRLRALRHSMGYVQNGSDVTIRIGQDDATKDFFFGRLGQMSNKSARSFTELLDELVKEMDEDKD